MNPNKIFLLFLILTSITLISCTTSTSPKIELSTTSFDLGDINPDEGIRTEEFFVKNTGSQLLKITAISTSCGCTEAKIDAEEIMPGEKTKLTVTYDPSVHPGLEGKIKRVVYIKSNDPTQEEIELELTGNSLSTIKHVKDDKHKINTKTRHEDELKEFEISPFKLHSKINKNETFKLLDVREDFEYQENHIKNALLLSVNKLTQKKLDKLDLKKDDEIILYCRSGRRSAKAYKILSALGYTNIKSMNGGLVHWMEEGFPIETGKPILQQNLNTSNGPKISFDRNEHDFGEITQFGGVVNTTFQITNNGNSKLKIYTISTSCGCTTAKLDKLTLEIGETTTLNVDFNPNLHEEPTDRFSRTVFLETNDPTNPEAELKIWVDILEGK